MVFGPGGKVILANVAVPLLSVFVARIAEPFRKVTLPVGVPVLDCSETVAVKVVDFPCTEGFTDELSVEVVAAAVPPVGPKICNCWLLATNTRPFATTGTRFASPPMFGQLPAAISSRFVMVVPPDSGLNAYREIGASLLLVVGRDIAQIMGFEVPLEETEVKKPAFCPEEIEALATSVNNTWGEVATFQTRKVLPPLLTIRPAPSDGSTKYDAPHQH